MVQNYGPWSFLTTINIIQKIVKYRNYYSNAGVLIWRSNFKVEQKQKSHLCLFIVPLIRATTVNKKVFFEQNLVNKTRPYPGLCLFVEHTVKLRYNELYYICLL